MAEAAETHFEIGPDDLVDVHVKWHDTKGRHHWVLTRIPRQEFLSSQFISDLFNGQGQHWGTIGAANATTGEVDTWCLGDAMPTTPPETWSSATRIHQAKLGRHAGEPTIEELINEFHQLGYIVSLQQNNLDHDRWYASAGRAGKDVTTPEARYRTMTPGRSGETNPVPILRRLLAEVRENEARLASNIPGDPIAPPETADAAEEEA